MDNKLYENFIDILKEELIPAMGCTEPIALAYASAKGAEILGEKVKKIKAYCSGNIIKNVRCVRIPNSGGMTGVEAACSIGALCGDAKRNMEVLETVNDDGRKITAEFLASGNCEIEHLESNIPLHFIIELQSENNKVKVEVRHDHTNIALIEKNSEVIFTADEVEESSSLVDRSKLSIENIFDFAENIDLDTILPFVKKQISCNMAIAEKGMEGGFGLGIGKEILEAYAGTAITKAKAYAAAASEARMEGCDMPVIITSGSGNQGIASTVPLIVYARESGISEERLYRSLVFSSLLTVFQKEFIGKLSAFCGAVSASCASGAAITYMIGGSIEQIKDTIDNTMANIPGIICDGAKASCAAKIASALDAAFFAHALAMKGKVYEANTGILQDDTGETIKSVGHIGKVGMKQTDSEIVKFMIKN